jgi:hypothetical protein
VYVLRSACAHGVASARLRPRDPKGRGSSVKEHANVLPWSADRDDGVHGLAVPATTRICPCQIESARDKCGYIAASLYGTTRATFNHAHHRSVVKRVRM